ncbi:hypothetical protein ACXZ1K_02370 [Pedobacter sp. PWIIR3]
MAAALAILAFGFSAFTTVKDSNILRYYKTDATLSGASSPTDYLYYAGDRCEVTGALCSAEWDIGNNPAPADGDPLPAAGISFVAGSEFAGHFE